MLKVMHVSDSSLLDDLFLAASPQTPQLSKDSTVSDRVLDGGTSSWRPALGHRARRINIRIEG